MQVRDAALSESVPRMSEFESAPLSGRLPYSLGHAAFLAVGAFDALEPAVYFALVSFTTAGFGDITLGPDWRLLSGLTTANGFLMFGWSTAYMVELMRRTA